MNILGIHEGHNASVALFQEDRVTYAVSEERLVRNKNEGGFPARSIQRALDDTGLTVSALDAVALCGMNAVQPKWAKRDLILKRYRDYCRFRPTMKDTLRQNLLSVLPDGLLAGLRRVFRPGTVNTLKNFEEERMARLTAIGVPTDKVLRVEHHECHTSAAYYGCGNYSEPVLVLSCDGGGDGICASINIGDGGRIKRLGAIPHSDSIAKLYALITYVMGFVPLEHEYKLMGLSPYSSPERARKVCSFFEEKFEWINQDFPRWQRKKGLPPTSYWYSHIKDLLEFERFDSIAGGLQIFVERMMTRWVKTCIAETGLNKLVLSGGIFMNVKMNKLLMELDEVESIFVHPSCGDETNPFGACYAAAIRQGVEPSSIRPMESLYLGPIYQESDVAEAIAQCRRIGGVKISEPDSIENAIAQILAGGEVVARYNGREEFGARALGNRSLLADPSRFEVIHEINKMIKQRDFWMPFAGSMTKEDAKINLDNPKDISAPYMVMTFDAKRNVKNFLAATHPYDKTIRPQVVEKEWNPGYHKVITELERITGKNSGVLNTSFNLHGYPIVSSPADAVDVFVKSGLKYLALENFLIKKQ